MIICIVFAVVVVGLAVWAILDHFVGDDDFCMAVTFVNVVITAVFIMIIASNRVSHVVEKDYKNLMIERESLVYRLNNQDTIVGNELLYNDIVSFNQKINSYKMDRNNPWISWFIAPELADIELIDYHNKS